MADTLTSLLEGSMVTVVSQTPGGKLEIGFDDGAWISTQTLPGLPVDGNVLSGAVIEAVKAEGDQLSLTLDGRPTVEIAIDDEPIRVIPAEIEVGPAIFNPKQPTNMNDTPQQESTEDIGSIAHRLWEEEGRPEGKAEEHWQRAEALVRQRAESPGTASHADEELPVMQESI